MVHLDASITSTLESKGCPSCSKKPFYLPRTNNIVVFPVPLFEKGVAMSDHQHLTHKVDELEYNTYNVHTVICSNVISYLIIRTDTETSDFIIIFLQMKN